MVTAADQWIFQTGLKNVLGRAVLKYRELHEKFLIDDHWKVDEIPTRAPYSKEDESGF